VNQTWIAIIALALSAAGCKQGLGERCEVDSDCSSGVCSTAQPQICVPSSQAGQGDIDATVPLDAPGVGVDARPDAAGVDAPPDGP
jgi:hypothetical protein